MAPNDSKSIPSWQRATSLPGAEDVSATKPLPAAKPDETESTHEVPRKEEKKSKDDVDDVREEAFRFLNDPSIKNATRERKAAFLESKGLKKEDIELLMSSLDAQPVVKVCHSIQYASTIANKTSSRLLHHRRRPREKCPQ